MSQRPLPTLIIASYGRMSRKTTPLRLKAPTHKDNVKPFKSIRRGCQRTGSRAAVPRVQSDKNLLMATQLETFAECRIYRHPATSYVFCYTQLTKQERSAKLINAFLGRIYWLGEFHTSGLGVYFLKHKLVCSNRKQNFIIVYACYAMNRRRAFKCFRRRILRYIGRG